MNVECFECGKWFIVKRARTCPYCKGYYFDIKDIDNLGPIKNNKKVAL